jgi:hypothetical protein
VDLSGSRAVTSTGGITPSASRVTPVHIGKFSDPEATKYVSTRTPKTFKDPERRAEITNLIVTLFDAHVATLQKVCKDLRLKMPTDMHGVTCKHIGLWNADAHEVHPFQIDPFGKTMSLTGNAILAVLRGAAAEDGAAHAS